jgi:hypothetical protein
VRGTKGRWYRDLAAGGPATLEFAGRQLAVQAIAVSDPTAVARASQEYLQKYQPSPYAQAMVPDAGASMLTTIDTGLNHAILWIVLPKGACVCRRLQ